MKKGFKGLVYVCIVIACFAFFFGGGIEGQVANDCIKQYELAVRSGDKMSAYTQASLVTAAFLQADDEENYFKWKAIEKDWAKKVGLSY